MPELFASVAVSDILYPIDKPYDYLVPESLKESVRPGVRVTIPFSSGNRTREGLVLRLHNNSDYPGCKPIRSVIDAEPILTERQIALAIWMRERYFCTVYEAVRTILPAGIWYDEKKASIRATEQYEEFVSLEISSHDALELAAQKQPRARAQAAVLRFLAVYQDCSIRDLKAFTGAGVQSVKSLEEAGALSRYRREHFRRPKYSVQATGNTLPVLSVEQQNAYDGLRALLDRDSPEAALLFGITGSGKTSVYLHLIRDTLDRGKDAILLVPEIALTPQTVSLFSSYFGDSVAVLHSSLSMGERFDEWRRIRNGLAHLVIGTRSAVFSPVNDLGLLIIDEEHESSYKSSKSPRYHASEIAKFLSQQYQSLLVFGSATPDLRTMHAALSGKLHDFRLTRRFNQMELPSVSIVDRKAELRSGNSSSISLLLRNEISLNLDRGEQTMLFLNRRGTAKTVFCKNCGYTFSCDSCSANLTYHQYRNRLVCHYCGKSLPLPSCCPECGGELILAGDGTEKIESELSELFPSVPVLRVDADSVAEAGGHDALFTKFISERIPIMIGTQMIAKGLNFSNVTLVGVLFADQCLYSSDYRAAERTFSLITQVIGRSGRSEKGGRAVIQTFTPENDVIRLAAHQDYLTFCENELSIRRELLLPPFARIYLLSVSGVDEQRVLKCAQQITALLKRAFYGKDSVRILGPAPEPVVKVCNRYRYSITVCCPPDHSGRSIISKLLIYINQNKEFRGVSVYADTDPQE